MRKLIIKKKMSFDIPPKPFYMIIEVLSNGAMFNWQGIYNTVNGARDDIQKEAGEFEIVVDEN